jgi:hypothetical protein
MPRGLPKIATNFIVSPDSFEVVVELTGVFRGSPALWAGSSDTNQEINLYYRDAPPCRRGASFVGIYLSFGRESIGIEVILVKLKQ